MRGAIIFILLSSSMWSFAQSAHMRNGDRLYREKKYAESLPEFLKAVAENEKDPVARYNLGNAYFRNGKYEEAEKSFDVPVAPGNSATLRQRAFYNKGVSFSRQNKLDESIAAYKNALLLNPADNDARVNLQKALLEKKKNESPEKQKQQQQKDNKQKQDNPPPQSKLNKKQVDQLLKALDQHEQQVQQKMMQNRARGVTKPEKDW